MAFTSKSHLTQLCALILSVIYSSASEHPWIKLSSGHLMPAIGLGTAQIEPKDIDVALTSALESGYRLVDTAFTYGNEEAIGLALRKWFARGINRREDIFVTTKLPMFGDRYADVGTYLNASLERLGLDYVDLYLFHLPTGVFRSNNNSLEPRINPDGTYAFDYGTDIVDVWQAMEAEVRAGRAKSIGLSNFNETQVSRILKVAEIQPSCLEIELHINNQQKGLREFCRENGIAVTAYSSFGAPGTNPKYKSSCAAKLIAPMKNPIVRRIAAAHKKTPAQVLLRHQLQEGVAVIPKSKTPERIRQNGDVFDFELTEDELAQLDDLDRGEEGRIYDLIGAYRGIEKHPEYPWRACPPKA